MGLFSWLRKEATVLPREEREDLRTNVTLKRLDVAVDRYNRKALEFEIADRRRQQRRAQQQPKGER